MINDKSETEQQISKQKMRLNHHCVTASVLLPQQKAKLFLCMPDKLFTPIYVYVYWLRINENTQ